jgi:uncharacterized protein YndB with AHSA1/START domain/uncharacterized glyoxalase superfamily protein PhnB
MNANLLFNFTVNKEKNSIHVEREFAAGLDLIWDAWTKPELLDQWWAPEPYKTVTKTMDFREGGYWLFYMISPTDEKFWSRVDFQKIEVKISYSGVDGFSDERGNLKPDMPRSRWTNVFRENDETTTVRVTIQYDKLDDLEQVIAMGFKEGLTRTLANLDQYIEAQFKLRAGNRVGTTARVCTYLNFPGQTEEAFYFYREIFRTEFLGKGIQRFGDIPQDGDHPPIADPVKNMFFGSYFGELSDKYGINWMINHQNNPK